MTAHPERDFWEANYAHGRSSGPGSEGVEAAFKVARIVSAAKDVGARDILDLGHGDGAIARSVVAALPGVRYHGIDISPTAVERCRKAALAGMVHCVGDITVDALPQADLVICLDVLFHLSTAEKHRLAVEAICTATRKIAVVAAWNEKIVALYKGKFSAHTFYRPFTPPSGFVVDATDLPMNDVKTLHLLRRGQ